MEPARAARQQEASNADGGRKFEGEVCMARRTLNRRELRAAAEAAEARERKRDDEQDEEEDEEEEGDEEDDELDADVEDSGEDEDDGDEEDDEKPKKKKKKPAKPKAAKPPAKRRTAKNQRMRIVWTVFNNSNQPVAKFEYPRKNEADALANKLTTDKKSTHFVQAVKEPMEEKAEAK